MGCSWILVKHKRSVIFKFSGSVVPRHYRCTLAAQRFRRVHYVSELSDEDTVMLIQLVFILKGLHGRDVKTCFHAAIYKLADNIYDWNKPIPNRRKYTSIPFRVYASV
uniref:Uncharacterized protein n=1 Tax=Lactuca sativa TaxID=4236 RepID=A0A9R1V4S3_LACSA|nr:hypothetical protein LSAT_V11C600299210 [Lactuca sativa]